MGGGRQHENRFLPFVRKNIKRKLLVEVRRREEKVYGSEVTRVGCCSENGNKKTF